jgi:hypothetical protein
MDATFFTNQLSAGLTAQGGVTCIAAGLNNALMLATLAYSAIRPVLRRIGDAQLVSSITAGTTTMTIVGGLYKAGDTIYLDYTGINEQTATVVSCVPLSSQGGNATIAIAAKLQTLTISAGITGSIDEGALITTTAVAPNRGLLLAVGRDTYRLPGDFVRVDQDSFDLAIGARATIKRGQGFYDAAYSIGDKYSGVGFGGRMNYGASNLSGYPINGNPFNSPNALASGVVPQYGDVVFRFSEQQNKTLTMTPVPTTARYLDFYYQGCHIPASLPAEDFDAIIAYAMSLVYQSLASDFAGQSGGEVFGITEKGDRSAAEYGKMAAVQKTIFDQRVRFRPILLSG